MRVMTFRPRLGAVAGLLCALMLGACATAKPAMGVAAIATAPQLQAAASAGVARDMLLGARVAPPVGFLDLCGRQPDQCGLAGSESAEQVRATLYRQYYWPVIRAAWAESQGRPQGADGLSWAMNVSLLQPGATNSASWIGAEAGEASSAAELAVDTSASRKVVEMDDSAWAAVIEVNRLVNNAITPREDRDAQGNPDDYWATPIASAGAGQKVAGDCEDYALEKRRILIPRGVSPEALSLAVVRTNWGDIHAVLLVATNAARSCSTV